MKSKRLLLSVLLLGCTITMYGNAQQTSISPGAGPSATAHVLMPVPEAATFKAGALKLGPTFGIAAPGHNDERLRRACERFLTRLERRSGLEFRHGFVDQQNATGPVLVVDCKGPGSTVPSLEENESYSLEVSDTQAVLSAPTAVGILRGLETVDQLVQGERGQYSIPAVSIRDKPRFPWRGLLIDVGRHFQPIELIKRELDGMASVKLNVFHWHLTEDQGFRVESKKHPKLHELGSDGLYYTQEQIRDVIAYARDRGIRVVPEFDMPGHATSWFVGYPGFASQPGPYQIERKWGIFDPAFDPTREEVYKFLDEFIGEMATLFPDAYMHIGGDESNGEHWAKNPKIQAFMKEKGIKDNHALQKHFTERLSAILTKHGKRMIGWDEIASPDLPKNIVVQSWRGQASLAEGAKNGFSGILSHGYYLDHMLSTAQHYVVDPIAPDSGLSEEQMRRILGGEACMWTEYVDQETIDSRIWPRLAAIAERLWSPRTVVDVEDMYRRLAVVSVRLEEHGLKHESNRDKMLRRLAGNANTGALRTLADVVEPMKFYRRGENHPTTQLSPLTRLVDAARPESLVARNFALMVDGLMSDAPQFRQNQEKLVRILREWRDVRPSIDVLIAGSPLLSDAEPLARNLSEIGLTGLEAVSYLAEGLNPPAEWRAARLAMLEQASKPTRAAVDLAVIPAVKQLVIAAAERPGLSNMGVSDWKKRIKSLSEEKKAATGN
jgi:hexosaminidase